VATNKNIIIGFFLALGTSKLTSSGKLTGRFAQPVCNFLTTNKLQHFRILGKVEVVLLQPHMFTPHLGN
jgi:hypothetical protein